MENCFALYDAKNYSSQLSNCPTHQRGIKLTQLNDFAEHIENEIQLMKEKGSPLCDQYHDNREITWDTINMYNVNDHFVKPMTTFAKCSFVSIVAGGSQIPSWFVSHSWSAPFKEAVELLNYHAKERNLPPDTVYWICTFANNQHNLEELKGDIMESPFSRVIQSEECVGTVALIDTKLSLFTRAWCIFENYLSTSMKKDKTHYRYDIAAMIPPNSQTFGDGDASVPSKATLRLDEGDGDMRDCVSGDPLEGTFPLSVSAVGVTLDISKAEASVEADKKAILNRIAGIDATSGNDPPTEHKKYDQLNTEARKMFAGNAAYWFAVTSDVPALQKVLNEFPDVVNFRVTDGASAALACCYFNCVESLEVLINHGADLKIPRYDGETCWTMAKGKPEILELIGQEQEAS